MWLGRSTNWLYYKPINHEQYLLPAVSLNQSFLPQASLSTLAPELFPLISWSSSSPRLAVRVYSALASVCAVVSAATLSSRISCIVTFTSNEEPAGVRAFLAEAAAGRPRWPTNWNGCLPVVIGYIHFLSIDLWSDRGWFGTIKTYVHELFLLTAMRMAVMQPGVSDHPLSPSVVKDGYGDRAGFLVHSTNRMPEIERGQNDLGWEEREKLLLDAVLRLQCRDCSFSLTSLLDYCGSFSI